MIKKNFYFICSQFLQAAKDYADSLVVGLWKDRGNYDASGNTYPTTGGSGTAGAIKAGNLWIISVAGTLGGVAVGIGDTLRAITDAPGQTAANWAVLESNIGYAPENSANKSGSIVTDQASAAKYPSVKSVYDWATGVFLTSYAAIFPATNTWTGAQITAPTALTINTGAVAVNLALANCFTLSMSASCTLSNPTNLVAGQGGKIIVTQHASAAKTLTLDSNYYQANALTSTISATLSSETVISYVVMPSGKVCVSFAGVGVAV